MSPAAQWLDWQPIESAPKDGTRVLLWPGCWPAHWCESIHYKDERPAGWLILGQDDPWYTIWRSSGEVTHWAQVPSGPPLD